VIDDLPIEPGVPDQQDLKIKNFAQSGIVNISHKNYSLRLRNKKKPININFGSDVGGGVFTYLGFKNQDFVDQFKIPKWANLIPGSFQVRTKKDPLLGRLKAFLRDNKKDIKFRLYVSYMEFFGGRPLFAMCYPFRHILKKCWMEMKGGYASHWDCETACAIDGNQIVFDGALAKRSGERLKDAWTRKTLDFYEDRIEVKDQLYLTQPVNRILFGKIHIFKGIKTALNGFAQQNPKGVLIIPKSYPASIELTYTIQE